jgi:hypothetical protein
MTSSKRACPINHASELPSDSGSEYDRHRRRLYSGGGRYDRSRYRSRRWRYGCLKRSMGSMQKKLARRPVLRWAHCWRDSVVRARSGLAVLQPDLIEHEGAPCTATRPCSMIRSAGAASSCWAARRNALSQAASYQILRMRCDRLVE